MQVICQPSFLRPHNRRESLGTACSHSFNLWKHMLQSWRVFRQHFCLDCYCKHMRKVQQELFRCFPECIGSGCTFFNAELDSGIHPGHQECSCQTAQGGGQGGESSEGTWLPELNVDGMAVKCAKSNFIFKFLSYLMCLKQRTFRRLPS